VRKQFKFKRLYNKSEREVAKSSKSECAAHETELQIYDALLRKEKTYRETIKMSAKLQEVIRPHLKLL